MIITVAGIMKLITVTALQLTFSASAFAQQAASSPQARAPSPSTLAELVLARFATGTPEAFALVFPIEGGRRLVSRDANDKQERRRGVARVVWSARHRAVLIRSSHILTGNSGDDTIHSTGYDSLIKRHLTFATGSPSWSRRYLSETTATSTQYHYERV